MLKNTLHLNKYKNRDTSQEYHEEYQYLNLLKDILQEGIIEKGRNGNVKTIFGSALHFSLENGQIPILTTKKTAWKTCLKELLWFIQGKMDNKLLKAQNVHIWNGNSSPEFRQSVGLDHYEEGDLGPIYGFQWRHFNAHYQGCDANYEKQGVDQLQEVIDCLKDPEKRTSRRMIVSAWNPCQIKEGVLPSCHNFFQFHVSEGNKLSCSLYQRSNDTALGTSFNISSYAFLTHLLAKHCDLEAHEFIHYMGNAHIYEEHLEQMKMQCERVPYPFPKVIISHKRENINNYELNDFVIKNYIHHEPIKMKMVA
jgi:thymidylate synthase